MLTSLMQKALTEDTYPLWYNARVENNGKNALITEWLEQVKLN